MTRVLCYHTSFVKTNRTFVKEIRPGFRAADVGSSQCFHLHLVSILILLYFLWWFCWIIISCGDEMVTFVNLLERERDLVNNRRVPVLVLPPYHSCHQTAYITFVHQCVCVC